MGDAQPSTPAAPHRREVGHLGAIAVALLLTGAAYAPILGAELQFDDQLTIERSAGIRDLAGPLRALFLGSEAADDRPVTHLTFALNRALGGASPAGYHLVNVLLHLLAVGVLFRLGVRLARLAGASRPEWIGALAASLFALHPIQSGAVSYVSQRAEVLASLLYAVAFLLLLECEGAGRSRRAVLWYLGAGGAFLLALGAKSIAVTLPVAYLGTLTLLPSPEARRTLLGARPRLALVAPFLALAAWHATRTLGALAGVDAGFHVPGLPPAVYALTQLRVVATYLRLLALPIGQSVDWDLPASRSLLDPPSTALCALLLLALVAAAVLGWRRSRGGEPAAAATGRLLLFGVCWFLLILAPTSSFVPLADVLMEHRLYLASWGIFLSAVSLLARLTARSGLERVGGRVAAAGFLLAACGLAAALHARNGVWLTQEALWTDAAAKAPGKGRPLAQLAMDRQRKGRTGEAIALYGAALERFGPNDAFSEVQTRRNLATALVAAGRPRDAVEVLQPALALAPGNAEIATNLAVALARLDDLEGAERWVRRAISARPQLPEPHDLLGSILLRSGGVAAAEREFSTAAALAPEEGVFEFNRGVAMDRLGRRGEACAAWDRASRLRGSAALAGRIQRQRAALCP